MTAHHRLASAADPLSRRELLANFARTALGVTALSTFGPLASLSAGETAAPQIRRGALACIYLYMRGGMSHLDTFDPKPGHPDAGPLTAITTAADGLRLSENFPLLAKQARNVAVIRSLTSNQGAHVQGEYLMRTSYSTRGTVQHPTMGAWAANLLGKSNPTLPPYITIGAGNNHPGAGYMESRYAPLPLAIRIRVCQTASDRRTSARKPTTTGWNCSRSSTSRSSANTTSRRCGPTTTSTTRR